MNKEEFLAAVKAEVKEVEVAALGVVMKFKIMSGKARDAFYAELSADKTNSHFEAAIVAATVVDDNGALLFNADDLATLKDQSGSAVGAVAKIAMSVNGIGVAAQDEAAKN
jgi:hypothetical protein